MTEIYMDETTPITTPDYILKLRNILDDKEIEHEKVMREWHKAKSILGEVNKRREDLERSMDVISDAIEELGFKP